MLRSWRIPAASLVLVAGAALTALAAGGASAAATPSATHTSAAKTVTVTIHTATGTRTVKMVPVAVARPGSTLHQVKPSTQLGAKSGVSHASTTSTNWSGYAADSGTYSSVSATWVQPTGTCGGSGAKDKYSSFWVGLDGYSSSTVEQTGTDTDCVGSTPSYYGWYETYPNPSYSFGDAISPGDTISASVTYESGSSFEYTLSDKTKNWSVSTTQTESSAARSSAEVIVEAPCCTALGQPLQLADFGTVNFSDSVVDGSAIGNTSPEQITMVGNSGNDKDTVSSLSAGENWSATWKSAK